jgi:hypothetical protein
MNHMLRSQFKVPLNLLYGIPKLGASHVCLPGKQIPAHKVFGPDEIIPQLVCVLVEFLDPFNHKSDVDVSGVEDSQSPSSFGLHTVAQSTM